MLRTVVKGLVVALLATAAPVAPAPARASGALPSDLVLSIDGGGWGHGHGMSQYGARAQAEAGRSWRQIISYYYTGITISDVGNPWMRVLLDSEGSTVVVGGEYAYVTRWTDGTLIANHNAAQPYTRARATSSGTVVERSSSRSGPWETIATGTGSVRFVPSETLMAVHLASGQIRYYRGRIEANRRSSSRMWTINQLRMDHYLYGVVPREMPASWHLEGLRAQAVAARSYSGWKRNNSSGDYHICATTYCQVYGGYGYRNSPSSTLILLEHARTRTAVDDTSGLAATYTGYPIFAEYHSSSGGHTTWGSRSYLAPVEDPWDAEYSPHHRWKAEVTVAQIESKWPAVGRLRSIGNFKRDGNGAWGGRVQSMTLVGTDGSVTISGSAFRSAFSWSSARPKGIRDTLFSISLLDAELVSAPELVQMDTTDQKTVVVRMRNTGSVDWPVGGSVMLGTDEPIGRTSEFSAAWQSPTRATSVTANVTDDGSSRVAPGQVAEFRFVVHTNGIARGFHRETLRLVSSGAWFGPSVAVNILVNPVAARELEGDLIGNHSFEDASSSAMAVWGNAADRGAVDTSAGVHGSSSFALDGNETGLSHVVQDIELQGNAGDRYHFSTWNASSGSDPSGGYIEARAHIYYQDGSHEFVRVDFPRAPHAWTYGHQEFVTTGPYSRIRVTLRSYRQTGSASFDVVRLVRNEVTNGWFDAGSSSPSGWTVPSRGARDDGVAAFGASSLRLAGDPSTTVSARQKVAVSGDGGERWHVSGWGRTNGERSGRARLVAKVHHRDGTASNHRVAFPAGGGWSFGEASVVTAKPYRAITLFVRYRKQAGNAWFDGVRLAREADNLVTNFGFEQGEGTPERWRLRDTRGPVTTDAGRIDGARALRLAGARDRVARASQRVADAGAAGETYVLSGWNRTSGTSADRGPIDLEARVRHGDGSRTTHRISFARGPHGWTHDEVLFTTVKPYRRIDVFARLARQTGEAWFDAVVLRRLADARSLNGGFERGGDRPEAWDTINTGEAVIRDASYAVTGDASLRLPGDASRYVAVRQDIPLGGVAGDGYRLSAWGRASGWSDGGGVPELVALLSHPDGTYTAHKVRFGRSSAWALRSVAFVTQRPYTTIRVVARYPRQTGTAWFDEVRLDRIG